MKAPEKRIIASECFTLKLYARIWLRLVTEKQCVHFSWTILDFFLPIIKLTLREDSRWSHFSVRFFIHLLVYNLLARVVCVLHHGLCDNWRLVFVEWGTPFEGFIALHFYHFIWDRGSTDWATFLEPVCLFYYHVGWDLLLVVYVDITERMIAIISAFRARKDARKVAFGLMTDLSRASAWAWLARSGTIPGWKARITELIYQTSLEHNSWIGIIQLRQCVLLSIKRQ